MPRAWTAWLLDVPTVLWLTWIVAFLALETWALWSGGPEHTLTWHLRPILLAHPLAWCVGFGFWLWLGVHFLAPRLEQAIIDVLAG